MTIYGHGWVGRAMKRMFPDAWIHDPVQGYVESRVADVAFVCVPTPVGVGGALDMSIVESVVRDCRESLIIIRSTLMPGTADKFADKRVVVHPEYLGETVAHPFSNSDQPFMILGGKSEDRAAAIAVYQMVCNANVRIREVTAYEAEVIKLSENRAIAFKIAQCQELYDACQKAGLNYNTIREAVYGDDPRFNLWWTFVYPESRGFNSKCIPKDVYGWAAWAESLGCTPILTRAMLQANERYIH